MTTVYDMILIFEKLQSNFDVLIAEAIEQTAEYLTDEIKEQLFTGTDATGNKITPRYKNARYAQLKARMNSKPGLFTPDLKLSGRLYQGLFSLVYEENLLISSNVDYAGILENRYGIKIFEPNRDNLNQWITKRFRPVLMAKIEALTGLQVG